MHVKTRSGRGVVFMPVERIHLDDPASTEWTAVDVRSGSKW